MLNHLQNNKDLDDLKSFFIPGHLYTLQASTPAFLSDKKYHDRKWEWLYKSYDHNNKQIPIMFIDIIDVDAYNFPSFLSYKFLTKSVYLKFLYNKHSIYVPVIPGKHSNIFSHHLS